MKLIKSNIKKENKTEVFQLRLTKSQKLELKVEAKASGRSVAKYILTKLGLEVTK